MPFRQEHSHIIRITAARGKTKGPILIMNRHILLYSDKTAIKNIDTICRIFIQEYSIITTFIIKGPNKETDRGTKGAVSVKTAVKVLFPCHFFINRGFSILASLSINQLFLIHIFHGL